MAKGCPYCGTLIGPSQGLCSTCHMAVVKYPEQNQVVIDAYVKQGLAELEESLEHHAAFEAWLTHQPKEQQ